MREAGDDPVKIVGTDARYLYWTFAQMITHQSCGGTNLCPGDLVGRSEEHTSELQSLMRISYAVFCLKKKNKKIHNKHEQLNTVTLTREKTMQTGYTKINI